VGDVTELRVALTVADFDQAVAFYRDVLGLAQLADWSSESGRVILLEAGRATLELFDEAQAETDSLTRLRGRESRADASSG
jgi:catechol 2,3-dioxygenase-like lactoylglutathione lyase family enzyme